MQLENYDEIMLNFEEGLTKKIDRLKYEYSIIRAGRANPKMLDKVTANYYGVMTPIAQMANISVPEARMIVISPWDISTVKEINKAILASDLGVTPTDDGRVIRLNFPMLTEERRRDLVKQTRKLVEDTKVICRNARRDAIDEIKKLKKDGEITEDAEASYEKDVQKILDENSAKIEKLMDEKEKEIMQV